MHLQELRPAHTGLPALRRGFYEAVTSLHGPVYNELEGFQWSRDGREFQPYGMVSVRFSPLHPLATPLQESFSVLFRGRVWVGCLCEKLAAAGSGSGTLAVSLAPAPSSFDGVTAALPFLPGGNRVPR